MGLTPFNSAVQREPRRLGVLGGAFDPPHRAHLALAQAALAQCRLDELRVLPTGQAWHKTRPLSPAVHRLAMTRLAFAQEPRAVVDDRELRRSGPTYTMDTLRELQAQEPGAELYLVMGEDQARALPTWHNWEAIVQLAIICVAARANQTRTEGIFLPQSALIPRYVPLEMPPLSVSATDIRARIAAHQGVAPLVGDAVARYIDQHHLYQTA